MRLLPKDGEHGWTPYLWLIYLGPYIVFPFLAPGVTILGSRTVTLATWMAGLAAFLTLYFRSHWVEGSARLPRIIALALLGGVLARRNPGALMFFIYAAGFVGGAAKPAHAGVWIGALTAAGVVCALMSPWEPLLLVSGIAIMTPLIGFVNLHYSEARRRDAALKLAQEEIARLARLAERERIAGDLHDLLGHTLSVVVLKSELAAKLLPQDSARALAEIRAVERVSREALAEVRRAVHGFRNATLADELLRARAVLQVAGVHADVISSPPPSLAPHVEHALAMILREAVTNVVRHAKASHCCIRTSLDGRHVVLQLQDDGVGGEVSEGAGIASMRARAREVGGSLEYGPPNAARFGSGMLVTVRVPVVSESA